MDFSENISCTIQEEVSNKFYFRDIVSLFTVVIYKRVNGELLHRSFGVVCDDRTHDTAFVFQALRAIRRLCSTLTSDVVTGLITGDPFRDVEHIYYFTDGAAQHFKNRFAMWILGNHLELFHCNASWIFSASYHGKGPCDGVGACLKSMIRRDALREPSLPGREPILNAADIFRWAHNLQHGRILVAHLETEHVAQARSTFALQLARAGAIKQIRSFHDFRRVDFGSLECRHTSDSVNCTSVCVTTAAAKRDQVIQKIRDVVF